MATRNRFSKYAGSKLHFVDRFNELTKDVEHGTYIEPFFGSGAVFFNLKHEFKRYIINDKNKHVLNAVASFKHGTYEQYSKQMKTVNEKFGDIKKSKEAYYAFRDWFNVEYFDKGKDIQTEGFYFHFLMNSCINSLVRVGPNGFNQSWGNRLLFFSEGEFLRIKERLDKHTVILSSMDYKKVLDEFDSEDAVVFLDPPYFARNQVGYQSTYQEDDLRNFLTHIKKIGRAHV